MQFNARWVKVVGALVLFIFALNLLHSQPLSGLKFYSSDSAARQGKDWEYKTSTWSSNENTIRHYVIERSLPPANITRSALFLTITRDPQSWGRNPAEKQRSIHEHLELVRNTTLEPEQASVGLLTSSEAEYQDYLRIFSDPSEQQSFGHNSSSILSDYPFQRVTLILHQADTRNIKVQSGSKTGGESDDSRESRHNVPQHERRARLAKLRNYLQTTAIAAESHVVWLDSDVYRYSSDTMVEAMMNRTADHDYDVGIVTARCRMGEPWLADAWLAEHPDFKIPNDPKADDTPEVKKQIKEMRGEKGGNYEIIAHKTRGFGHYDLNAWAGTRTEPTQSQLAQLWNDISAWTPSGNGDKTQILDRVITDTTDQDIKRLDSVGGTILVMRADLVRMGLIWPPGYFVQMTFEHGEGFDGIESEGLCLVSRSLSRDGTSMCFTMGGSWSVWHTIF